MRDLFDALRRELFGGPAPTVEDPTAPELRELTAARRQIRLLLERGEVDAATFESVDRALEARRVHLLAGRQKHPLPAEPVPVRPSVEQLEDLLRGCDDPRSLSPSRRQDALACWRQLTPEEIAALSSPALLALARLLRLAGLTSRALTTYRQLVDRPAVPGRAEVALEAARFAASEWKSDEACLFLEAALASGPGPETRGEAEELLRRLRPTPAPQPVRSEEGGVRRKDDADPSSSSLLTPPSSLSAGPPPPPRKPLTRVLAAFMEERNILWGELVGVLLIVGCSVALVITLWKSLERLPYFPFLIFSSVTAALFGAGLYTLHHWKLTATSRGLLVIALLLTPLNLLVLAEPSGGQPGGWLELAAKVVALFLFTGLVFTAGRDLIGPGDLPSFVDRRWLLVFAVVGAAAVPLVAPGVLDPRRPLTLLLLGLAPTACYGLAVGAVLVGLSRPARKGEAAAPLRLSQAYALLLFLGASLFALATALGFLLTRGEDLGEALHVLSIPFALGGAPVLSAGLLVYRRTAAASVPDADAATAGVRTAGTAVGLGGVAVLLAAVALAWPAPAELLAVCAWGGGVLTVVAFRRGLALAHAAALTFLALAWLIAAHLAANDLSLHTAEDGGARLALLLGSSTSAAALTVFALAVAAAAEWLARWGRRGDAVIHLTAAGAAGLVALGLATWHGFAEPGRAVWTCGLCGAGALAVNFRWRRAFLPYVGLGLCAAAGLWGLLWARSLGLSCGLPGTDGSAHGVCGLVLATAALALAAASAALRRAGRDTALGQLGRAARDVAAVVGLFAAVSVAEPTLAEAAVRAGSAALLAAAALVLAQVYRRRLVVWVGSAFLLAAFVHWLVGAVGATRLPQPLTAALLGHATLTLAAGLAVRRFRRGKARDLCRLFGEPLRRSALFTSLAAAPLLLVQEGATVVQAGYAAWIAVLWLATAWAGRSPSWFTAFQAALTGAVLLGATAWLQGRGWVRASPLGLADPRALQGYGVALTALGLAWVAARFASSPHPVAGGLWRSGRPSLDRVVLGGLVVGQTALALWGIVPGVVGELVPTRFGFDTGWPAVHVCAYGAGAWVLLGCLAVVLTAELLQRGRTMVVRGLLTLALTVPVLAAGPFAAETATASALRWGTAACFVSCAAVHWLRRPLGRLSAVVGVAFDPGCSTAARRLLVAAATVIVLSLTAVVAALGFAGEQPAGPDAASFFAHIGWTASNVVPLVVLSLGLAGFAVRERSPGYAFAAGLVADVSLMGGYALAVVTAGGALDAVQFVRVLQLGSLGAALWALGWLVAGRWVRAWRETPRPDFVPAATARPLMLLQIGGTLAGNALLLVPAVLLLALPAVGRSVWTVESGSPLGWAALLAGLAAPAGRRGRQCGAVRWPAAFLAGAAILGLTACTIERTCPGAGYRALLFGGAGYALLWAWAPFLGSRHSRWVMWISLPTFAAASNAVLLLGAAVVGLALQGAAVLHDAPAAAAAVGLVAAAVGTAAYGRNSGGLAFLAGACGNLAVTLIAIHFNRDIDPGPWVVDLVQVNAAACAATALLWQAARRFLGGRPAGGELLTLQAMLGLFAQALLLLAPFGLLLLTPGVPLPAAPAAVGDPGGWATLLATAAAALWRLGEVKPHARIHVLGLVGLSAGVLAACAAAPWDAGDWLSFHVLTLVWVSLGFAATAVGSLAFALRTAGLAPGGPLAQGFAALFPARRVRGWLEGVGLAVAFLAFRGGAEDPYRPYSTATTALAVSVMAGALALWFRRSYHVYASGLLFTAAGMLVWSAWGADTAWDFGLTIALCLAASGAFWSAVDLGMRPVWKLQDERQASVAASPFDPPAPFPSFPHAAAGLALSILTVAVASVLAADATGTADQTNDSLAWAAAAALAMGLGLCLWDRRAFLAPAGLYALGLTAVGLGLHSVGERGTDLGWAAALALAGYAASAAALARIAGRANLGLPPRRDSWFLPAQAGVACAALALSAWMCVGFDALGTRLGGPAAVVVLAVGGLAMVGAGSGRRNDGLRAAVLLLVTAAAAEAAAALPDPAGPAAWLNRCVGLLPTLTFLAILYRAASSLSAGRAPAWAACGRRLAPVVGGLAALAAVALATQELRLYDPASGFTPMTAGGAAVAACGLAVLAVAAVAEAVRRGRDAYVYAAEGVLALLFVHLRLNAPALFDPSAARYWTLIVLAVAFLGAGLGEFFGRSGPRVLAAPLRRTGVLLPLLPLLAFWVRPPQALWAFADLHAPGLRPFLAYLEAPAAAFDGYALVWLLVAGLYAGLAAVRRSPLYALLAALAADCGLWSLLTHYRIAFFVHPQAWLIPLGLILLTAEHLNRHRLRPESALGLRYLGLTLVYVSSTADLFIAGIGNSVVLPVVLAVLAVLGALAGVWLRVRAFLFLGVGFLALDVFTMIWHAAVDREQTWVWWASGIVLGAAILTLFAVFEKRRSGRKWEGPPG